MHNSQKMIEHINRADREIAAALEAFHPSDKISLRDSYLMGHLRSCQAVLASARTAISESAKPRPQPKAGEPIE